MEKQEEELEKLKWGREMDERRERRNNIIIKGIGKRDIKDGDEVKKWFKKELNLEVEVDGFWHIGDKSAKEYRLGVRMHDWENKQRVMGNKSKLRGKEEMIFIDNDLTQQERKVRRVIAEEIKKIKVNKKDVQVKSGYYWLQVGDKRYRYEERGKQPGFILEKEASRRERERKS